MSQPSLSGQSPDLALDAVLAMIARIIDQNSAQIDATGALLVRSMGAQLSPDIAKNLQNLDRLSQKNKAAAEALRAVIVESQQIANQVSLRSDILDAALHLEDFGDARRHSCAAFREGAPGQIIGTIELF